MKDENAKSLKGVIYYRVSTAEQAEHGFSLGNQREACLKHAMANGIEIVGEFHDDGASAKTADRDGLQEMLKFCSTNTGKVDCIIVNKIDRLSRDVNDYTNIRALLHRLKVRIISTTEAVDNTPFGKFIGNIMATVAQLDNDVRSERVTDGMVKCLESGRWPWKAPLGYLNYTDPTGRKEIVLDSERHETVTYIFEEF